MKQKQSFELRRNYDSLDFICPKCKKYFNVFYGGFCEFEIDISVNFLTDLLDHYKNCEKNTKPKSGDSSGKKVTNGGPPPKLSSDESY